ncbi:MAG TPA: hypothetical protein VIL00_16995 [Pseudonocardiaceae bacterium]
MRVEEPTPVAAEAGVVAEAVVLATPVDDLRAGTAEPVRTDAAAP